MSYRISDIPTHNTTPGGGNKIEMENPTGPVSEWATLTEVFAALGGGGGGAGTQGPPGRDGQDGDDAGQWFFPIANCPQLPFNDPNFKWDGPNSRVTLGSSTLTRINIDYTSTAGIGQLLFSEATTFRGILSQIGTTFSDTQRQGTFEIGTAAGDMVFRVGGVERMRVNATNGRVSLGPGTAAATEILDISGNMVFTGASRRITGDFTNATHANRVLFQTTTANSSTVIGVIPSGSGASALLNLYGGSDPEGTSAAITVGQLSVSATSVTLQSNLRGSGGSQALVPITFAIGGSEIMRLVPTTLCVGIGTLAPDKPFQVQAANNDSALSVRSGASGSFVGLSIGRTANEGYFGVSAGSGAWFTGSVAGDCALLTGGGSLALTTTAGGGSNIFIKASTGNVAIGAGFITPDASAILDLSSTTKGFGLPSMTTAQRDAISTPREGLKIWNTTTKQVNFYSGASWTIVASITTSGLFLVRHPMTFSSTTTDADPGDGTFRFDGGTAIATSGTMYYDLKGNDGIDNSAFLAALLAGDGQRNLCFTVAPATFARTPYLMARVTSVTAATGYVKIGWEALILGENSWSNAASYSFQWQQFAGHVPLPEVHIVNATPIGVPGYDILNTRVTALTASRCYTVPFRIQNPINVTAFMFQVSTISTTGGDVRFLVYKAVKQDGGTYKAYGNAVIDTGKQTAGLHTVDTTTTNLGSAVQLAPGYYVMVMAIGAFTGSAALRGVMLTSQSAVRSMTTSAYNTLDTLTISADFTTTPEAPISTAFTFNNSTLGTAGQGSLWAPCLLQYTENL